MLKKIKKKTKKYLALIMKFNNGNPRNLSFNPLYLNNLKIKVILYNIWIIIYNIDI